MFTTEQTKGQTVFQHGQSVLSHTFQLIESLKEDTLPNNWRIPACIVSYKKQILESLHTLEVIAAYTQYHDCGKPFCRIVGEDGKVHFPNHADVSREVYLAATGDLIVSNLIGWDMCLHTANSEEISMKLEKIWTKQDAITLFLVALSEIHSNATMFGGIESISFKMKYKTVEKRGKQICKYLFEGK